MASRARPAVRVLKWLLAMALAGATAALLVAGGLYLHLAPKLPDIEQLQDVQFQEPLRVYARGGELMGVFGTQQRIPLRVDAIPREVQNAFIAGEDDRFYEHPGVDWMGLTRAAWNLVLTGEKGQGGSTITMQVARNFFLSREKTYLRKLNEILLALKIERHLTKDQILELYLNKIYLGQRAYGVGAAAQIYYGKDVDELTLAETAMIAGLPKAPSFFNPVENAERALQRRNYVLRRMLDNDMITDEEFYLALAAPVTARSHSAPIKVDAPYVAEMARLEAVQRFGEDVYTGGYRVYTTIDAERQRAATGALRRGLVAYERRHGYTGPVARIDPGRLPAVEDLRAQIAESTGGMGLQLDLELDLETEPQSDPAAGEVVEEEPAEPADSTGILDPKAMDALLEGHEPVGHLEPALVLEVDEEGALVYGDGRGIDPLPWTGMEWAAPRREDRSTGEEPEEPADVLAAGDIVYVGRGGEGLHLAQRPRIEGALVALDPDNGAIRALSGGFDFERSKFNRVTQARRQPGSNFKPFIYSAALGRGFTPATLVNDAPVVFEDPALEDTWRPENYSGRIFGPTRLREGLVHSRNLVSIRVLLSIGIPYAIDYLQRFGFPEDQLPHDLTLALGSAALTPLQVATGYSVFANSGFRVEPYLVERVEDSGGEVLYRANPARVCPEPCEARDAAEETADGTETADDTDTADETGSVDETETADATGAEDEATAAADDDGGATGTPLEEQDRPEELADVGVPDEERAPEPRFAERVVEERNAYIVRSMMRDVVRRGTARGARALGRDDIAGKTGTTDDQLDAWFSGFNGSLVATAWVGYDQMESLGADETGARAALPMWVDFMRVALADTPEEWPELPPGMVTVRIDPETGEYAGPQSNGALFEIFRSDNAPQPEPRRAGSGSASGDSGGRDDNGSDPLF